MKAKILVRVERDAALEAIRTLDALGAALSSHNDDWPKHLKRQYRQTRDELVRAAGVRDHTSGIAALSLFD